MSAIRLSRAPKGSGVDTEHIRHWPFTVLGTVARSANWAQVAQGMSAAAGDRLHMITARPFAAACPAPIAPVGDLGRPLFSGKRDCLDTVLTCAADLIMLAVQRVERIAVRGLVFALSQPASLAIVGVFGVALPSILRVSQGFPLAVFGIAGVALSATFAFTSPPFAILGVIGATFAIAFSLTSIESAAVISIGKACTFAVVHQLAVTRLREVPALADASLLTHAFAVIGISLLPSFTMALIAPLAPGRIVPPTLTLTLVFGVLFTAAIFGIGTAFFAALMVAISFLLTRFGICAALTSQLGMPLAALLRRHGHVQCFAIVSSGSSDRAAAIKPRIIAARLMPNLEAAASISASKSSPRRTLMGMPTPGRPAGLMRLTIPDIQTERG